MMSFTPHHLTFEYLCFAVLLVIQHLLSWPCSHHAARAGCCPSPAGSGGMRRRHHETWGLPFPWTSA